MPTQISDVDKAKLISAAQEVRKNAYVPYSHYQVGAALLTADGQIYTGCNVENASYPVTLCAERVAVGKAVSEGTRKLVAAAVITENGGSPCGMCRQVMYEFGPNMLIIIADGSGTVKSEYRLSDLLPEGFGPEYLDK